MSEEATPRVSLCKGGCKPIWLGWIDECPECGATTRRTSVADPHVSDDEHELEEQIAELAELYDPDQHEELPASFWETDLAQELLERREADDPDKILILDEAGADRDRPWFALEERMTPFTAQDSDDDRDRVDGVDLVEELATRGARIWMDTDLSQREVAEYLSDDELTISQASIARGASRLRDGGLDG